MSRKNVITIPIGIHNEYKLSVVKGDAEGNPIAGTERDLTGWFDNLITDVGMDNFGVLLGTTTGMPTNWGRGLRVGSGSNPPAFTDTNLQTIVASTVTKTSSSYSRNLAASPPYVTRTNTYQFGVGVAAGNLTEVGLVGATNDSSGANGALNNSTTCSTRALILDGGGLPTTVTVLSDEILNVTCKQNLYIPGDVSSSITPTGGVVGSIAYVLRPAEIDTNPASNVLGWGGASNDTGWDFNITPGGTYVGAVAFVGASSAIGINTAAPSGTQVPYGPTIGNYVKAAYVPGNWYIDVTASWGLGAAGTGINDVNGIGAMQLGIQCCAFQLGFTPRMVKTEVMLFDATVRVAWYRYP